MALYQFIYLLVTTILRHRKTSAMPPAPVSSPSWVSSVSTDLPLPPATSVFTFTTQAQTEFVRSAFTYGFYLGLGRDLCGNRRFDTSDTWSNGPTHGIKSGWMQIWQSHRLVVRWFRSLRKQRVNTGQACMSLKKDGPTSSATTLQMNTLHTSMHQHLQQRHHPAA